MSGNPTCSRSHLLQIPTEAIPPAPDKAESRVVQIKRVIAQLMISHKFNPLFEAHLVTVGGGAGMKPLCAGRDATDCCAMCSGWDGEARRGAEGDGTEMANKWGAVA